MSTRRAIGLSIVLFALPAGRAWADVVDGCADADYLDRTAPAADRTLTWDFSIVGDPERCLKVRVGQSVRWDGDLQFSHPLTNDEGTLPNPISGHDASGVVVFTQPGTFGYRCDNHFQMRGAILVVAPAAARAVPSLQQGGRLALVLALLLISVAAGRRTAAAGPPTG